MFQWQKHGEKNQTKQNSYNGDVNRINRYPVILNDKATYIILQWLQRKTNPGVPGCSFELNQKPLDHKWMIHTAVLEKALVIRNTK